jgi:hypothetical protein
MDNILNRIRIAASNIKNDGITNQLTENDISFFIELDRKYNLEIEMERVFISKIEEIKFPENELKKNYDDSLKEIIKTRNKQIEDVVHSYIISIKEYIEKIYNIIFHYSCEAEKHELREIFYNNFIANKFDYRYAINMMYTKTNFRTLGIDEIKKFFYDKVYHKEYLYRLFKTSIDFPGFLNYQVEKSWDGTILRLKYETYKTLNPIVKSVLFFFDGKINEIIYDKICKEFSNNTQRDVRDDYIYEFDNIYFKISIFQNGKLKISFKNEIICKEYWDFYRLGYITPKHDTI